MPGDRVRSYLHLTWFSRQQEVCLANRRMLSKTISVSEQVNALSEAAQVFYTWAIPHLDDFGRISGNPASFKALVRPMCSYTVAKVGDYIQEIAAQGLINVYAAEGQVVIEYPSFEKYQVNLQKRTRSMFPDRNGSGRQYNPGSEKFSEFLRSSQKPIPMLPTRDETAKPPAQPGKLGYGHFKNVLLTEQEHRKVADRLGAKAGELIEELSEAIEAKGYKYVSHYAALLTWARRREAEGKPVSGKKTVDRVAAQHWTEEQIQAFEIRHGRLPQRGDDINA